MNRGKRWGLGCLAVLILIIALIALSAGIGFMLYKDDDRNKTVAEGTAGVTEVPFQKAASDLEGLKQKYHYGLLSSSEQQIYQELLQGIQEEKTEIYVHCQDPDESNKLYGYVLNDYPEFFWCNGGVNSTSYESEKEQEGYTIVVPVYTYTGEERLQKQSQIEEAANVCLSGISAEASEYEKILYVYEYIVNNVEYDLAALDNQNIYSVFVNKRSVCAGYSRSVQYLLERLGVFCTYVTGTASGQSHAWNLVRCEGEYSYVDSTWGDPVYQQTEGEEVPQWANISYDYMICSDEQIMRTHTLDGDIAVPPCTNMQYNYYVVNNMYYESYDSERILGAMNAVISQKGNPVVIKFSSPEVYETGREAVMNDLMQRAGKNLCDWYGLSQVQYYYQEDPDLCKITIHWLYE